MIADIYRFKPFQERDALLLHIMKSSPLMRIRGHGAYVTFEFSSDEEFQPLDAIRKWVKVNAGPMTVLNIVNFSGGQVRAISVLPDQLDEVGAVPPVRIDDWSRVSRVGNRSRGRVRQREPVLMEK